jgi:hypothetical protein
VKNHAEAGFRFPFILETIDGKTRVFVDSRIDNGKGILRFRCRSINGEE